MLDSFRPTVDNEQNETYSTWKHYPFYFLFSKQKKIIQNPLYYVYVNVSDGQYR